MTSRAYVFIDGLENNPVICGVVELDPKTNIGKFRYGQSYLQRDDALSQSKRFGLSQAKARTILSSVQALTNEWIAYFNKVGVPDTDIETLKGIIPS